MREREKEWERENELEQEWKMFNKADKRVY